MCIVVVASLIVVASQMQFQKYFILICSQKKKTIRGWASKFVAIFFTGKSCKELLVEIHLLLLGITLPLFFKERGVLSTIETPKRTPIMLNFIPFFF
jgi:hypothetical protein